MASMEGGFVASRRTLPLSVLLLVGTLAGGVILVAHRSEVPPTERFDAHSFAVFQANYETLRVQPVEARVDQLRELVEIAENSEITPAMASTLAAFCRDVLQSEDASEVKVQARLALNAFEKRLEKKVADQSASVLGRGVASASRP